jgi:hypothetical protein
MSLFVYYVIGTVTGLRNGRFGVEILKGHESFLHNVQVESGAQQASYSVVNKILSPGVQTVALLRRPLTSTYCRS